MFLIAMQDWSRGSNGNEMENSPENNLESMSRVDIDSLEPGYGRKNEGFSVKGKPPPPPPPPPPKKHLGSSAISKFSNSRKKAHNHKQGDRRQNGLQNGIFAWETTSSMYWKLLVVLELVLSLTDVVDDGHHLMYYQRIYLIFVFSAAILVILAMYIYAVHGKNPVQASNKLEDLHPTSDGDGGSLGSLQGTLRRAYIRRHALATTNFHLRLGAVVFGIATLIYYGFEIAVHTTGNRPCVDDVIYAIPIILVVFTFLQIHFLFVNSQVIIGGFRGPAQFCFAHLLATNVALWLKTVATQSSVNWVNFLSSIALNQTDYSDLSSNVPDNHLNAPRIGGLWWTTLLPVEFERVAYLTQCIHNTTLGQMWIQATPFLIPFLLQFCIVSAAVFYVLWCSMSEDDHRPIVSLPPRDSHGTSHCHFENKGIFIGLLLLVGGVVVLVMYLILRAQPQFVHDSLWVVSGTLCLVLAIGILAILIGFLKLQGAPYARAAPTPSHLDALLVSVTSPGPLIYSVLGLVVSSSHINTNAHLLVMAHSSLLFVQVILQNVYIAERWRRVHSRSGRQMIQVLLFANAALWMLDTFMTASTDSQRLQEMFYGPLLWGILSYTCTPLVALYRFHSSIQMYELWKRSHS